MWRLLLDCCHLLLMHSRRCRDYIDNSAHLLIVIVVLFVCQVGGVRKNTIFFAKSSSFRVSNARCHCFLKILAKRSFQDDELLLAFFYISPSSSCHLKSNQYFCKKSAVGLKASVWVTVCDSSPPAELSHRGPFSFCWMSRA